MSDDRAPHAPEHVATETITKICDYCGGTFELRKRVRTRRFCDDRCRNQFHLAERERWRVELRAAIDVVLDRVAKLDRRGRR